VDLESLYLILDPNFSVPDQKDPRSRIRIRIKEFKYLFLTPKMFLRSWKYDHEMSPRIPDQDFSPSRISGSKKHKKHRIPDPDQQHCSIYFEKTVPLRNISKEPTFFQSFTAQKRKKLPAV
jgi:hypothetical protein